MPDAECCMLEERAMRNGRCTSSFAEPLQRSDGEIVDPTFTWRELAIGTADRHAVPRCVGRHANTVRHDALAQHHTLFDHYSLPQDRSLDACGVMHVHGRTRPLV